MNKVEFIKSEKDILQYLDRVLELIDLSYKNIGGYFGDRDLKVLAKQTSLLQVVKDDADVVIACAIYRQQQGGNKLCGIACDQSREGKDALKSIIQTNIEKHDANIWAEVSEAIEHYYKKYNGYPIPNCYAPSLLEAAEYNIKIDLLKDGFHYSRIVGAAKKLLTKVIFGFSNKKVMLNTLNKVGYDQLRNQFNTKQIKESDGKYTGKLRKAVFFVNHLKELYDIEEITELIPATKKVLDMSIDIVKDNINKFPELKKDLKLAEQLKQTIPMIKVGAICDLNESLLENE